MGHSVFGATLIIVGFVILLNTGLIIGATGASTSVGVNLFGLVIPTYIMQWTGLLLIILGIGLWLSIAFTFKVSGTRK